MPRKHEGTIVRDAEGRFIARVRLKDGSRPRIPLEAKTEGEARTEALRLQARANRGEDVTPKQPREPMTLKKWAETWLEMRKKRGLSSVPDDTSRLGKHVYPALGDKALDVIRTVDVRMLLASLPSSLPSSLSSFTQRNIAALLRKLLADAARAGHLRSSPWPADWRPPRRVVKQLQFLFPSDVARLAACDKVPLERRRLWCLLTYTGVRVGELEALQVQDFDGARGTLTVSKAFDRKACRVKSTKSGKPRTFRVEPAALPLLRALTKDRAPGARLVTLPCFRDHLPKRLRGDLKLAGVAMRQPDGFTQAVRVHDLRATYITWRLARGEAPLLVRDAAGHSEFSTTEIYWRNVVAEAEGETFFPPLPAGVAGVRGDDNMDHGPEAPRPRSSVDRGASSDLANKNNIRDARFPKPKVTSSILVGGARIP